MDLGAEFLAKLYGSIDLAAVAFAILATGMAKRILWKDNYGQAIEGHLLTRLLPFFPALFGILFLVGTQAALGPGGREAYVQAFSKGIVSGTFAAWLYNVKRVTVSGG